jgi:Mor family transcriptional regulator
MTKSKRYKNKTTKKYNKKSNKRIRRYKGGAEYYTPVGDPDRDSVDEKMELNLLEKFGIENTPDDKQHGWLSIGIAGMLAVGGIGYLVLKKK